MLRSLRSALSAALLLASIYLTACGGRALNKTAARGLIADAQFGTFAKEDVYIESVNQTGRRDAIIEARLKAAFRFEQVGGKWTILEVRLGNRQWERLDDILAALKTVKTLETQRLLEKVAGAVAEYQRKNGMIPQFKDYVSLADQLNPDYLTPLIRLDAWRNPLAAFRTAADAIRLLSAGPDAKFGTPDDIELTRSFPR